ncbi:hypothetical protein C8Q73DRAFT_789881 [Cubamyces lactineus]|nr:hypothetical protein C8Q73DRAFT_789881 [Cubamyces lactineus]
MDLDLESSTWAQRPSLNETLGAILLGAVFGFMLHGLMLHQAYRYYRNHADDSTGFKILVLSIVVMETFHTILWIMVCYEYLVTSYFNPISLNKLHWYIRLTIPTTAFTGVLSGIFYAGRLYYLGPQYRPLVAIVVLVLILSLGWDLGEQRRTPDDSACVVIHDSVVPQLRHFRSETLLDLEHFSWIVSVAYGLAVLCGVITVSALIFALRRSRTGAKRTNAVVDILVLYMVNTVYSNSVFAMLNSRRSLSARLHHDFAAHSEEGLSRASRPTPPPRPHCSVRQGPILIPVTIDISTTAYWDVEAMAGYSYGPDSGSTDKESTKTPVREEPK